MHFRTRAIHVGQECDPQTGAVVPPIHVASTFVQPGAGVWGEFDYSRSGYPDWERQAWAAALVLLAAVMSLNVGIRLATGSRVVQATRAD